MPAASQEIIMKQVKPAGRDGSDVSDGFHREWFKVGRKFFGISGGYLIDAEGFHMSGIDDAGHVVDPVHDKDAYRVAEAIRRCLWVEAKIMEPFRVSNERSALH
jgi:hypothetical protein